MKVLLSIKPEYAFKILNGEKRYEFRKVIFKNKNVSKIVIYATKPVGKIIGEFDVSEIIHGEPSHIWKSTKKHSGITHKFFAEYFNGKKTAFAIGVKNPCIYHKPLELSDILPKGIAPQSFCYIR